MENPFRKRATEYLLRDEEAFLAIVTPEPITYFLEEPGADGRLYDRLVLLRGTPGSGKTTLARMFEFPTFHTLLQNTNFEGHTDISAALESCDAISNGIPRILGFRLPLETDYRDFWEFDYSDDLKTNLMTALLQARAVLGWFRHLKHAGIDADAVHIVTRPEATEVAATIGGTTGATVRKKAADVERAIYNVMNALIAPNESDLPSNATEPYRPFDIIEGFTVPHPIGQRSQLELLPLAIFDDAHELHPNQFEALERFLLRRELRVARWLIARFDILRPQDVLAAVSHDAADPASFPGVSSDRESEVILLQSTGRRADERARFRRMSKGMAGRYLRRMPVMSERGLTLLTNLLADADVTVKESAVKALRKSVTALQKKLEIKPEDLQRLETKAREHKKADSEELVLAMLTIMMHRFDGRRRRSVPTLFDTEDDDRQSDISVAASDSVYAGALFQLFHKYDRPYFFGIDDLCDASSENAEQFLQLAAELVEAVVTQVARNKSATLPPDKQHALLRKRGEKIIEGWRFPQVDQVRTLVAEIAARCLEKSLQPNAPYIANAIGIRQEQFETLAKDHPELARVIKFAIAYNAISLVPHHSCKNKSWCLFELGGMALLRYGLTLKRGGFIESNSEELAGFLGGNGQ